MVALPVPVLLLVYAYVSYLEKQSRAEMLRVPGQKHLSKDEIEWDVRSAGFLTALVLAALVGLSARIIAATFVVDWAMVDLIAAVIFLLSILIMLPYIPHFIIDSSNDERKKLQRESEVKSSLAGPGRTDRSIGQPIR